MNATRFHFKSLLPLLLVAFSFSTAKADPPGISFELDGNSVVDGTACTAPLTPSGCRDDWNLLNGDGSTLGTDGKVGLPGGSLTRSFVQGAGASPQIFTTGGSKDTNDVPSWKWRLGSSPDKDEITNGYAAAYKSPFGHYMLLFGADRFAVNGDANIGLWFFQQDIHPVGATSGGFSGAHTPNDLFIVSAFTQGGGVSTITVYAWDPTCTNTNLAKNPVPGQCADNNLKLVYASTPSSSCATSGGSAPEGCSIVNPAPINVSWPYLTKFGSNNTTIPQGGLYEGGLDISDMFQLLGEGSSALPCFSSFLIETRSSQATSAVLKDFIAGSFNVCGMNITKACSGDGVINSSGTAIHYRFTGTVTNTGIGGLNNVTIVDTLPAGSTNATFYAGSEAVPPATPGDPITPVALATCPAGAPSGAVCADIIASLDATAAVNWAVEFDSTSLNVTNNATAIGASTSGAFPGACTDSGTVCTKTPGSSSCKTSPNNSITITKACGIPDGYPNAVLPGTQLITQSGLAAVQVNFSGVITNSGQSELAGVTLTDNPAAIINVAWPGVAGTIPVGGQVKYSGRYLPSGVALGDLGTVTGRYVFSDEIKITGAHAVLGPDPGADGTCLSTFTSGAQACNNANCHMCPGSSTCGGN